MDFDVIVIGGGITGAGVARDCAMRGLKTLLVERGRPGRGTTAASSRLIHGGMRYLLYDRLTTHATAWDSGHIVRIARPLLRRLPVAWPVYRWHDHGIETVETLLEAYDAFQRMKGGRPHLRLSARRTLELFPGLRSEGLVGSAVFDEWTVDPVALVESNMDSARRHGAQTREGLGVSGLLQDGSRVTGVRTPEGALSARVVINAAGPWIGRVAGLAGLSIPMRLRKGTHLIYRRTLKPYGLLLEGEGGGRYVFILPVGAETLLGPTDLDAPPEPDRIATAEEEIRYLRESARLYFPDWPAAHDATMVGARPILGQAGDERLLSREFEVFDHETRDNTPGLITIGGGKMSDFRMMAEATTNAVCLKLGARAPCRTHLETLAGEPVGPVPPWPRPPRPLRRLLRSHPRLRQWHALAYLGGGLLRHVARRALGPKGNLDADLENHYRE